MEGQEHLTRGFAPDERVLPTLIASQAERYGSRPLLVCGGERWSFADARDTAAGTAGALRAAGIGRGDRVALMCGNRPEFLQVFLGAAWIGAVVVPINTAAKGPQLAYLLRNSGARLLVIDHEFTGVLALAEIKGTSVEEIWIVNSINEVETGGIRARPLPGTAAPISPVSLGPGDTLAILYTSGTTGPSKGVCVPHAQYFWWGANTAAILGVRSDDVLCTTLPLFHVNALNTFAQALLTGARQAIEPRFSVSGFWSSLSRHSTTITYLLGAMVPMLLSREPSAEERLHDVRVALGPGVPTHLFEIFRERTGISLVEGYGSTETNFVIASEATGARQPGMGRVRPGFEARVVDDNDNELPAGTPGELVLRASEPFAFSSGYFGMPERTVEAWRNLWFHTGDRVTCGEDGTFQFIDRLKDAIRRRGENISSFEVEQVLLSHPSIETAAVFPVRSDLAEDEVMVAVVRKPGAELGPEQLIRFCEPRLPSFAVPRFVEFLDELPRTENGKVQKYKLRERGVMSETWDREAAGIRIDRRAGSAPVV